jgi:hypothetical protein
MIEYLDRGRLSIKNDITVHELRLLMRNTLSHLNCVHTKVRNLDTQYYVDFLPLDLIIQDGVCSCAYCILHSSKEKKLFRIVIVADKQFCLVCYS